MGPEDGSRTGKRKVRELCGPDGARRSIATTSGLFLRNMAKPRLAPEKRVLRA
jgi:hypothetical protein